MWNVIFDDAFLAEFDELSENVQDAILAYGEALAREGPQLSPPHADRLVGSTFANMKELRPTVNKVEWRVAYAFDPDRMGILLVAAAKTGSQKRFYKSLIATADKRYKAHLDALEATAARKEK